MAFGTAEEKKAIVKIAHRAHGPVKGEDYSAFKDLQLWVAATLYASGVGIYEEVLGKIDESKADALYQQSAVLGTTLCVPQEMWPVDRKAFREYWDDMIASSTITPDAIEISKNLLYNK